MGLKRRRFSRDFKLQVLYEIEGGKSIVQASREHQIQPSLISKWHKQQRQYQERAFGGNGNTYTYSRIGEFIEKVYNQKRLHSALGYVPPAEFEQVLVRSKVA